MSSYIIYGKYTNKSIHKKYIRATCKHAGVQSKTTAMEMDYETDDSEQNPLNSAFE